VTEAKPKTIVLARPPIDGTHEELETWAKALIDAFDAQFGVTAGETGIFNVQLCGALPARLGPYTVTKRRALRQQEGVQHPRVRGQEVSDRLAKEVGEDQPGPNRLQPDRHGTGDHEAGSSGGPAALGYSGRSAQGLVAYQRVS
jgi:hypothetical protein